MLNCKECRVGKHNKCSNPELCLCANDSHGESLRYGVRVEPETNEPKFFEKCQNDKERLDELMDNGLGDNSPEFIIPEMVKLMIGSGHLVSKIDIVKVLKKWGIRFGVKEDWNMLVEFAWSDADAFQMIKQICFEKGRKKIKTIFDSSQLTEVSYYLMGRYHIKRIELTGNLIFFNDRYYEKNAEPLIRRKARQLLIKSKNGDMNEIVKLVEDSCQLIKWSDIEESIHIKCLKNGLYDIKKGEFSECFDPNYIILNEIPHEYNIEKSWKNIDEKVKEIITDDNDRESYYDSLSTALHPYTGIDFQFGGIGQPGTGKSQLCQLSIMVLGDDNVSASPIHLVASDLTTQKDVAFNFLNIDMDMSNETIRNIDVLKRWITQDKFTARGIYEHNTTFRPMARMCFMANDLYEIANSDDAEAIYERTHIIKLNNKFRGSEDQIKNLFQKIATPSELSGFITYLLRNATDIYNNQRIRHPINIQTVRNTWNLHGNRIREFCDTWIVRGDFREETSDVWNRWLTFTHLKDYPAKDKKKFYQIFDEIMGNSPIRTRMGTGDESRSVYAYSGFRLLRDEEIKKINQETLSTVQDSPQNIFGAFHAQSSKSSILSLLKITEKTTNYKLLEAKIIELLELYDYSRGDKQ